jgi:hypothetical protein
VISVMRVSWGEGGGVRRAGCRLVMPCTTCLVWTLPVRSKMSRRICRTWAACAQVSMSMSGNRAARACPEQGPGQGLPV